jgi:VWFA-related protein
MNNAVQFACKFAIVLPLSLVLGALPTSAQDGDIPAMRTTTRLVQLQVVVLDKDHPVHGLMEKDFQVFDNGVRQKIVHFSASPGSVSKKPAKRSPLIISNRAGMDDEAPGVTVIMVDELVLDAAAGDVSLEVSAQIRRVRLEVLSFLAELQPGQQVAIYALRREGAVVIHDFTDDPAALADAAKSLGGGGARGNPVNLDSRMFEGARPLSAWRQNAPSPGKPRTNQTGEYGNNLMAGYGFQGIIKHLAGVPGRKNLVWISATLPSTVTGLNMAMLENERDAGITAPPGPNSTSLPSPQHPDVVGHYNELLSFSRRLSDANIAVYPIDAFGLTVAGSNEGQWAAADIIASETGGRAVFNSNALDQHLREIVAESQASYQIGFYPGDAAWDGKFHHIQLKLAPRHRGLTVLSRKGYYAIDAPPAQKSDAPLWEAARGIVEAPAIGVTLNVSSNPLESGPEDVVVKLDFQDIQFERKHELSNANLDVAFVQLGRDGRVLDGFKDRVALGLLPKTYSAMETQGWLYSRKLVVLAQSEKLRVVVRDLSTGAVGSVSVPVHTDRRDR